MYGALERVSVVIAEILRPGPVGRFLVAHMALTDLVQYWLAQHRIIAHVVHRSRLHCTHRHPLTVTLISYYY